MTRRTFGVRANRRVDPHHEEQAEEQVADTVTCLRCGAVYEAGAVVCFKCGAPIGEISTPTQPIARRKAMAPPPDPPLTLTVEKPPREKKVRPVKQPRPPKPPRSPAMARSRRKRLFRIALFAALALAILGVGAWGARALLAGPPVPRQVVYQDPAHRFRLNRPGLWSATPAPDGVLLADSSGASSMRVTVRALNGGETALSAADALATERNLQNAAPVSFADTSWERRMGQFTGRDGAVRQVTVNVAAHGPSLYVIELASPLATYASADTLVFQPTLASFQFT
jgi:ribosomal protein L40E